MGSPNIGRQLTCSFSIHGIGKFQNIDSTE